MTTTSTALLSAAPSAGRALNFSAGPATLPETVLRQAQSDLWSIDDSGIGIMEHSHRGKVFDRVIAEAEADCRTIGNISDDYDVLFLQGGATLQFAMLAMNFLQPGTVGNYLDTGVWTTKAIKEGKKIGDVHVSYDGATQGYDHIPGDDEITPPPPGAKVAYTHYCSNNTIYGTRFHVPPTSSAPLINDASSEMYSRPIDVSRHAMIYAGAQKNLGPSGVVLVIIRKDFMATAKKDLPVMLDYGKQAAKGSRLNTPPSFGIYVMGQVFKWILNAGGLEAIEAHNDAKAQVIYDAIEQSGGFYHGVARADSRSVMNVTFRTGSDVLDQKFVADALTEGLAGLKGHRDAGGLRASIYNAFPRTGCETLASFMQEFARRNG